MANDVSMMWTILAILLTLGVFVPLISNYFLTTSISYNTDAVAEGIGEDIPNLSANPLTLIDFGKSLLGMFFWSFNVHWLINLLILEPMRIIFYILLYRQIRSGGG